MNLEDAKNNVCPRAEIAEYVDGELTPHAELELELHFLGCEVCARELNEQKKLLNALDCALENEKPLELPENFAKVVVTNAESRVSGLRRRKERYNALLICAALFLLVILGLGSDTEAMLGAGSRIIEQTLAVGNFFGHIVYDFAIGLSVILKSLCFQFIFKSAVSFGFLAFLLGISALVFSRLITEFDILRLKK